MKKAILFVDRDERLARFAKEAKAIKDAFEEQLDFMKRRAKKLAEESSVKEKALWKDFEVYLTENKLYPQEYNKEKHHLELDVESGVLWCRDDSDKDLPDFLKKLLGG